MGLYKYTIFHKLMCFFILIPTLPFRINTFQNISILFKYSKTFHLAQISIESLKISPLHISFSMQLKLNYQVRLFRHFWNEILSHIFLLKLWNFVKYNFKKYFIMMCHKSYFFLIYVSNGLNDIC